MYYSKAIPTIDWPWNDLRK